MRSQRRPAPPLTLSPRRGNGAAPRWEKSLHSSHCPTLNELLPLLGEGAGVRENIALPRNSSVLAAPEDQPRVDSLGLIIFQWRQGGHGRGFTFIEYLAGGPLQLTPARPIQFRRVRDFPERAPPLDNHAVDVPRAQDFRDPTVFARRVFLNCSHYLLRARSILRRHAAFQVAGNGLWTVGVLANHRQAPRPTAVLGGKTKIGVQVSQVVNQFVDRIGILFQCRGHSQTVAL